MDILCDKNPANSWNNAFPIGNGCLGGMVFGGVNAEKIALNEDSLWYGRKKDRDNKQAKAYLEKIREAVEKGDFEGAHYMARMGMYSVPQYFGPYQPLCNLDIFAKEIIKTTDYKRSLDIENAVAAVEFSSGDRSFKREYFASCPSKVIVCRFTCTRKAQLTFQLTLTRRPFDGIIEPLGENGLYFSGNAGGGGVDYGCGIRVICKRGSVRTVGGFISVEACDEVVIYISAATSFRTDDIRGTVQKTLENAEKAGFAKLLREHTDDYKQLYQRCELKLSEGNELYKALFDYGRYLIIASSRPGRLPANLQGIWNRDFVPSWESKYTININLQMNYWLCHMCRLDECYEPFFTHLTERMLENGRRTAKEIYGARGFVAHHNTNLWGETAIEGILDSSPLWPFGGVWLTLHMWEYYRFTGDIKFLEEKAYPMLKENVLFLSDYLIKGQDGLYTSGPSLSPENIFITQDGQQSSVCMSPTSDIMLIKELLTAYIKCCEIIDLKDELINKAKEIITNLQPIKFDENGIWEWQEKYIEKEPGHRHFSHLIELYPGDGINYKTDKKLLNAAKESINRRLENGGASTGWSAAWAGIMLARLQDGEGALKMLEKNIAHTNKDNLFCFHNSPFQLDASCGMTEQISRMLLDSAEDTVFLLPALPKAWDSGEIKGLRAKGGFVFDIAWEKASVTHGVITSCLGGRLKLEAKEQFSVDNAGTAVKNKEFYTLEVNTSRGDVLYLRGAQ